jgi:hypothetical protein
MSAEGFAMQSERVNRISRKSWGKKKADLAQASAPVLQALEGQEVRVQIPRLVCGQAGWT